MGAGAIAGINYPADGTIDPTTAIIGGWVNVISTGNNVVGTAGWNPKFYADLRQFSEVKVSYSLPKEMESSNVPCSIGDIGGSISSEVGGKYTEYKTKQVGDGKWKY